VKVVDLVGQYGALLQERLGFFGFVPEAVLGDDGFDFLEAVFFVGEVKDSPGSDGGGRGFRAGFVSFRQTWWQAPF
jgi:hypothetical protein